jgi:hypothetical protein
MMADLEKPEINEHEAAEQIRGMGRVAVVTVHDNGFVKATAIFSTALNSVEQQGIQNEVDGLLEKIERSHRIVKNKKQAARWR